MKRSILILSISIIAVLYVPFSYISSLKGTPAIKKTRLRILLHSWVWWQEPRRTYLTDTILLVHINTSQNVPAVSIPRDLWVKIPTKSGSPFSRKINLSTNGLFPNDLPDLRPDFKFDSNNQPLLFFVLNKLTGFTIDGFVAVDFNSFVKTVDILGGIDVDIIKSFTDKQYPVAGKENDPCGKSEDEMKEYTDPDKIATDSPELLFPCRFETVEFKAGITHLSGTSALRYARSRHAPEDGGDFNRAQRQQKVLEAFRSKLVSPYFITRIPALYSELKDDVRSSLRSVIYNHLLNRYRRSNLSR